MQEEFLENEVETPDIKDKRKELENLIKQQKIENNKDKSISVGDYFYNSY